MCLMLGLNWFVRRSRRSRGHTIKRCIGQKSQGLRKVHKKKWFDFSSLAMSYSVLFHNDVCLQTLSTWRLTALLATIWTSGFHADYLHLPGRLSMVAGQIICVLLRKYLWLPARINRRILRKKFSFLCHVPYLIAVSCTICLIHCVVPTIHRSERHAG